VNDEELGKALRAELQALLSDISPSPELLSAITCEDLVRKKGRRRRSRWTRPPLLAAVTLTIAAAAAAIVLTLSAGSPAPAYAVIANPDGSVTVTIKDLTGVRGANAKLSTLGVRAMVVPMTAGCPNHLAVSYLGVAEKPAPTIKLIPHQIAAGSTVILAAEQNGPNKVEMALGKVTGQPPPPCVSSHGVGPGLPGWRGPSPGSRQATTNRGAHR
jgi:hypothetical protein